MVKKIKSGATPEIAASLILAIAGFAGAASFWFSEFPIPEEYQGLVTPEAFQLQTMIGPMLLVAIMLVAGHFFARRAGLRTPVLTAILQRNTYSHPLIRQIIAGAAAAAVLLTVLASAKPVLLSAVPVEQLSALRTFNAESIHPATRYLYGIFAEEIVMRWGVLGALAFIAIKIIPAMSARPAVLLTAAVVASSISVAIHAPTLHHIIDTPAQELVLYSLGVEFLTSLTACGIVIWRGLGAAMILKAISFTALSAFPALIY